MSRWLAIYIDTHGQPRAAMIKPAENPHEVLDLPFGVDESEIGLADYDGQPVTLVEMPDDTEFRPVVVDTSTDAELPMQFIDL